VAADAGSAEKEPVVASSADDDPGKKGDEVEESEAAERR
jgi:hypothetical protein